MNDSLLITKLEQSKRGRDRYTLRFSDGSTLTVPAEVAAKYSLYPGQELSAEEIKRLKSEVKKHNVKSKAAAIVSSRPISEKELKRKLTQRGGSEEEADEATLWLRGLGVLDDEDYAARLVRHYALKGYGKAKIKDEFYKRGIPRDFWEAALAEYSVNFAGVDRFLASKLKKGADRKELKRAADALYRRGFSWDEIREALSKYDKRDFPEE